MGYISVSMWYNIAGAMFWLAIFILSLWLSRSTYKQFDNRTFAKVDSIVTKNDSF